MKNYKEKIFKKIRKVKILYQIYIITGIKGLVYALNSYRKLYLDFFQHKNWTNSRSGHLTETTGANFTGTVLRRRRKNRSYYLKLRVKTNTVYQRSTQNK